MHIEDCANVIVEILKNSDLNGVYNLKGHERFSASELVKNLKNVLMFPLKHISIKVYLGKNIVRIK